MNPNVKKTLLSRTTASLALMLTMSLAAPVTAQAMAASNGAVTSPKSASVAAAPKIQPAARDVGRAQISPGPLPKPQTDTQTIKNIIQVFFGILGAFALLSMTASGLKYVTSGGDPGKTSEAKKGVVFSLVGLAVAVSAEAIVAFVVQRGAP